MTIAIDIDGTWTLDPWFWNKFYWNAVEQDYNIYVVTGRTKPPDENETRRLMLDAIKIICCGPHEFKKDVLARLNIFPDIWIDNEPGTIEPQRKLNDNLD